ncbi:transposase [uncultured Desulfuromonas sp.]|uniref:REP-associated tyrosine transposase n=1 Tax=uncultured Desulfuromonas sp. TaxID=181013 RepID=UPI002AAC4CD4|nr:transposase [uncultured Desulfuromonas sp.]
MARPLRIEYAGAFYHVTSRGNERKAIFKSQKDREKFLSYLESAVTRYGAVIHTWCLMDNHYHLLVETPRGNLSQIMRHINGAYTTYFNIKRQRSGHLFQGRYKAILIEADAYALELSRYIHLNPVRANMVDKPEDYTWSSYGSYIAQSKAPDWLDTTFVLGYFNADASSVHEMYRQFVEDRCERDKNPLKDVIGSAILGSQKFINDVSINRLSNTDKRNVPGIKALFQRPSVEQTVTKIKAELGSSEDLRNICIYCCRHYSGAKLKEIGDYFEISDAAVCQASRRLSLKAELNKSLKNRLLQMKDVLTPVKS